MNRVLLSVAIAGLMTGLAIGADLESGLKSGDKVSPFNPLNVTGPDAGEKRCQV